MILARILEHKKAELRHKQSRGYLSELKAQIRDISSSAGILRRSRRHQKLDQSCADCRGQESLTRAWACSVRNFKTSSTMWPLPSAYEEAGASALSVLTDKDFFQGSLDHLRAIKRSVPLPVLNKEFMVEEIQFYEARAYGADAVLLIVAALERPQLVDFHALARELSLDVLIETHHERELDTVLEWIPDARMIGINNRDLTTFATDLTVTKRLAPRIPSDRIIVSESGIQNRSHVEQLLEMGVHAMLVGESLIRAEDFRTKIQELRGERSAAQA